MSKVPTGSTQPTWWAEIADELANLNVVGVDVADTGSKKTPMWTVVITLHASHVHWSTTAAGAIPDYMCAAFPWIFAARPTEADAWIAAETFLRGLVAVRKGTQERVPAADTERTVDWKSRQLQSVCDVVETRHAALHDDEKKSRGMT